MIDIGFHVKNAPMNVLVVEDDPKIARFISGGMECEGDTVVVSHDGAEGLRHALSGKFDLVILDLLLPGLHGLELLRQLRKSDDATPVIVVSALCDPQDRVHGIDAGADDYLVKPFGFLELRSRIRALFRRTERPVTRHVVIGGLSLDRVERRATRGDKTVELTRREYQVLELFMHQPGEPLPRSFIADRVWGYALEGVSDVIDVYVSYLRKKLLRLGLKPIRSVRGVGFVFEAEACGEAEEK